ncbi:MAG: GFA family protein [Luteimonas sp.]|nr:GFA family protein [Luteimonas sp.]
MSKYLGSCHCGGVRFEIDTEHPLGPYFRCNCSLCSRKGAVMGAAPRSAFAVTGGAELIFTYAWNSLEAQHYFCRICGIYTHHAMRGETETIGVNMACIEGFDVFALGDVEVGDGKSWSLVQGGSAA